MNRKRIHSSHRGFTLVELLVVVTVLLILITMTVTAIDFTFNSERVRSAARQLQSALEGARDRAIFAKEPRGLRLLVDPLDPRLVTNLIYVGGTQNWSEGRIRLERMDAEEDANGNWRLDSGEDANGNGILDGNGMADGPDVLVVRGDAATAWYTLKERGFLGLFEDRNLNGVLDPGEDQNANGLLDLDAPRIKIPADDNGSWYTVFTHRLTAADQALILTTPYRDPGTNPPTEVIAFQGAGPSTYLLELPPRILPDSKPILLPEGVCIDLDGSAVPAAWRPSPGAGQTIPYSAHMDVMFSPRGVVTGPLAAVGLIHLYLAERKDVQIATEQGVLMGPAPGAPFARPPVNGNGRSLVPGDDRFNPETPIGNRICLTIFTQTGKVSTHPIDAADVAGEDVNGNGTLDAGEDLNGNGSIDTPDGYADNPFYFATQGEAAGQ